MNAQDHKIRYKDWAPTTVDVKGIRGDELEISDWFVAPVIVTRDSGPFEKSNFEAAKARLEEADPSEEDWDVHCFGHWGPGWFEIIVVKPGTKAEEALDKIISDLENYPILDEDDYSQRCFEEFLEVWDAYGHSDFVSLMEEEFGLSERACELLREHSYECREFWGNIAPEPYYDDGGVISIPFGRVSYYIERKDVAKLLRKLRSKNND